MKVSILKITVLLGILFLCSFSINKGGKTDKTRNTVASSQGNQAWMKAFNSGMKNFGEHYSSKAVFANVYGDFFEKESDQKKHLKKLRKSVGKVSSISVVKNVEVNKNIAYEIGTFQNDKDQQYHHLVIWRKQDNKQLRELEVILKSGKKDVDTKEIDKAREKWISLCNKHIAKNLVSELYTKNAIYFSHRPIISGTSAISKEYSYMNNPKYNLSLAPIVVEIVDENTVLEIGQCSGTYNGKYMLLWQRQQGSEWKILLDSNV